MQIFIWDCNEESNSTISRFLQLQEHQIQDAFFDADMFLQCVDQKRPDAIFLDIDMARTSTTSIFDHLRNRDIPVILITNRVDERLEKKEESGIVFGYLCRPIREKDVELGLRHAMKTWKLHVRE